MTHAEIPAVQGRGSVIELCAGIRTLLISSGHQVELNYLQEETDLPDSELAI